MDATLKELLEERDGVCATSGVSNTAMNDALLLLPGPLHEAKKIVALSGVVAGNTPCARGRTGNDLHYRGMTFSTSRAL